MPARPTNTSEEHRISHLFRVALAASLTISALLFFVFTWRWPLVGDAALIHYIAWLIQRGWAPYRQFSDMNMPGSYLIEIAAMRLFGTGALAWRFFDFTLMAAAAASFFVIARSKTPATPPMSASSSCVGSDGIASDDGWLASLFSASLFILIHGRDGLAEGGQRDLTMAVCLIVATAFLFHAVRKRSSWPAAAFGLFSGVALTIKPTALPLTLAQLALAAHALRPLAGSGERANRFRLRSIVAAIVSYLVAPGLAITFLLRERALAAFLANLHGLVLYYASLGHRTIGFLLLHSISPLLPLLLLWFAILSLRHANSTAMQDWERAALLCGAIFGLISYLVQARGFPYYRYTLLVFLLPLMALDFTRAFSPPPSAARRIRTARVLAVTALAFGAFILAPQSAILIHRDRWWQTDFIDSLQLNLDSLGGQRLSGHIQCIDTISGCGNVLYRMRLIPANGQLVDFPLFGDSNIPFVQQTRQRFFATIIASPPQVIVVAGALYVDGPGNFRKLDRWPAFANLLATRYTMTAEWSPTRTARWWSREETPASYRIYRLRSASNSPTYASPKQPAPGVHP